MPLTDWLNLDQSKEGGLSYSLATELVIKQFGVENDCPTFALINAQLPFELASCVYSVARLYGFG